MRGKELLKLLRTLTEAELLLPVRAGDEDGSRGIDFASVLCGGDEGEDYVSPDCVEEAECNLDPTVIFLSFGE